MTKLDFIATAEQTGERIDRFLSAQDTGLTRSAVQKLIEDGGVTVGGKKVSKNYKLHNGDSVEIIIPDPVELDVKPRRAMRLLPFSPTALENVFIYWAFCRFLLQSCCFFICHGTGQSGINVCSVQEIRL